LIPKILPAILRHVAEPERDLKIQSQCEKFQDVTLEQLKVKPSLQSKELVPFINSVTQLRYSRLESVLQKESLFLDKYIHVHGKGIGKAELGMGNPCV
jgi:hypothetical protein